MRSTSRSASANAGRATPTLERSAAFELMRPLEWVKNLFIFAPLLFSGSFDDTEALGAALLVFLAFSAIASAGYIVNDLLDVEHDRRHPEKRDRPIASGKVSERTAYGLAAGLALVGAVPAAAAGPEAAACVAGYGVLSLGYSLYLKHAVIIDVMCVAAFFLLRVVAGAVVIDVEPSEWLLFCTGMVSLFLGFTKRRQEAMLELDPETTSRPVLQHYSFAFLDQMVALVSAGTILSYTIYAIDSPLVGEKMLLTVPPVLYGIFRYLYLVYHRQDAHATTRLVTRDPGMIGAVTVWAAIAAALLYA